MPIASRCVDSDSAIDSALAIARAETYEDLNSTWSTSGTRNDDNERRRDLHVIEQAFMIL